MTDNEYRKTVYEWIDRETGYPCKVVKVFDSYHCGYVTVPRKHPAYGKEYWDDAISDIDVHGGITSAEKGEFGFDTAHGWETPEMQGREWVTDETIRLAANLKGMAT